MTWSNTPHRPFLLSALAFAACRAGPSEAELERLVAEANAANAAAEASYARQGADEADVGRALIIAGQVERPARLGWDAIARLADAHVQTVSTQTTDLRKIIDFRGVLARDLLDAHGAAPDATEVTFISLDGFRSTVDMDGLRRFDVLLAIEADGKPIPRSSGGPIFLVFPHTSSPETVERYSDRYWAYYVSHMIVGTEPAALRIGDRVIDAATLDALEQTSRVQTVGWKVHWPSTPVELHGVTIPRLLQSAGVSLPARGRVIVRGKASTHRDPAAPRAIPVDELTRCPFIVATHHGPRREPIPARLGGPLVLAVPPDCESPVFEHLWMTNLEELVVETSP